ncbi:MAG: type II toxin-antitoxin system HicA family toxin [Longimicrobiales bacterium]
MNPRLPSMTAPEVVRLLGQHGFERVRQSGSHLILRHPDGRRVTVPMHRGKDLGRGLLSRIMKDAGLSIEDVG